jgi:hypothetical protein
MMGPREAIERAMDRVEEAYNNGHISADEYHEEMRALQREYRDAAAEAAQDEYDNWFR